MIDLLMADIRTKSNYTYGSLGVNNAIRVIASEGMLAVFLMRAAGFFCTIWPTVPFSWLLSRLNFHVNSLSIPPRTNISKGFVVMHPAGVVINGNAIIGENVIVQSGVVIGAARRLAGKSPVIGSNVEIGTGAKILGDITVGNNVVVGANAVVVKDVPDGAVMMGIPAKVVSIKCQNKS